MSIYRSYNEPVPKRNFPGAAKNGNPIVFFDLAIGGHNIGRVKMELFMDVAPKTCENFRQLCTGEFRRGNQPIGYKGAVFHRVIKGFMCQGGDIVKSDGSGCISIYGEKFPDENLKTLHDQPGLLSMANSGAGTNGCQFFMTCEKCEWLDGKHVVFGKIVDGILAMRKMENVAVEPKTNKPRLPVKIVECGEL